MACSGNQWAGLYMISASVMKKLIEIFKGELFARETVQAIDGNKNSSFDETDYFTGHNLLNNSRIKNKKNKKYKKYEKI